MTPEHAIQNAIMLACGHGSTTLFRCNTGLGWAGKSVRRGDGSVLSTLLTATAVRVTVIAGVVRAERAAKKSDPPSSSAAAALANQIRRDGFISISSRDG